jgi:hypothetical protein
VLVFGAYGSVIVGVVYGPAAFLPHWPIMDGNAAGRDNSGIMGGWWKEARDTAGPVAWPEVPPG